MRLSKLFTRTTKEAPADDVSINAQYLTRGGFIYKNSAGIYSMLPLGWKVITKIANIIREEMDAIGGQEMFMPALIERKYLEATGRWNLDVGFFAKGQMDKEANFVMGWSHEDILTAIATRFINSYKDLPFATYQIQTKFRNEARPKSGLLRVKEFIMKDLYSFHASEDDLMKYYDEVGVAYRNIFNRCGLHAIYTLAAGGVFTMRNTHEFQVLTSVGEDTIYVCSECEYAENKEISSLNQGSICVKCGGVMNEERGVEVGNIFPLGTKYSKPLKLEYTDDKGNKNFVVMGSYGIGLGRLMATVVEVLHDDKGIIWPESIAPFRVHLISLDVNGEAEKIYNDLIKDGVEVLYDDRDDRSAGEKFADSDLIGCPIRLVVSEKTLAKDSVEIKYRKSDEMELIKIKDLSKAL